MERYAIPGMNCTNISRVVGGNTNYAASANGPITGSYRDYVAATHQKTMMMRRRMNKVINKELPKHFIDLPRGKQNIVIKGESYGYEKLLSRCHESIDGADLDSLHTAMSRFEKLNLMSCVRFLIDLIY